MIRLASVSFLLASTAFTDCMYSIEQNLPSSLVTSTGKIITTGEMQAKVVVLNFWFISCTPCLAEIKDLNNLRKKYSNGGRTLFIAISSRDDREQLEMFRKYKDFGFELIPQNEVWLNHYKVKKFPTNLILYKGQVIFRQEGYRSDHKLVALEKKLSSTVLKN